MKVQVLQEELSKALNICARFSATRVQLPVLANTLLETKNNKLRVVSTNLEVSVSMLLGAKIDEEGSLTVPSRVITEFVSNLKTGQITLKAEKETLQIKSPEFESQLSGMNSSDFPEISAELGAGSLKFQFSSFQSALSKVLFSVSSDETRPALTGVLLIIRENEIVFVTTDGFRLSQKKVIMDGIADDRKVIIPKTSLSEIIRFSGSEIIEFSVKKAENQVMFGVGNLIMSSRIIDGEFPDFEKIIPKKTNFKVSLDKEEFLRCVKLASVFARDSANVVKLTFDKNFMEIQAESQQFGNQKGKVDAKIEGDVPNKFTIAFNYRFLEDFLNVSEGDDIQMEFSDPNSPALFLDSKDTTYLHIIMPVRIQS